SENQFIPRNVLQIETTTRTEKFPGKLRMSYGGCNLIVRRNKNSGQGVAAIPGQNSDIVKRQSDMSTAIETRREHSRRWQRVVLFLGVACLQSPGMVAAQAPRSAHPPDALHQLNDSIEALVQRISP